MDLTSIVYVALTALFFVTLLAMLLVIIDHKSALPAARDERPGAWSIRGKRDNHPLWAWLVSMALWSICAMIIVGIAARLGFEHGGPQYALKVASFFEEKSAEEEVEESKLLKEIRKGSVVQLKAHFHHTLEEFEEGDPTEKGKQPVCFYCHGNYPHKRQRMIRTLLNMHTQFIGCMTCHLEGYDEDRLVLRWYNYSGIKPSGRPFGLDYDPETGSIEETDDYYSRITVFVKEEGGAERMMEIPEDDPTAQEFIRIRGKLTPEEQGKVKNRFHKGVGPKGRFCTRCHRTDDSFIPFKKLGFSERRIADLTGLNIVSIVQKYKEFYIPTIYRDVTTEEKSRQIMGPEQEPVEIPEDALKDPRFWWKQKYEGDKGAAGAQGH